MVLKINLCDKNHIKARLNKDKFQDTQEAIDKMAADVEAQKAKRDKFSRCDLPTRF